MPSALLGDVAPGDGGEYGDRDGAVGEVDTLGDDGEGALIEGGERDWDLLPLLSGGPAKACTVASPGAEDVLLLDAFTSDWIVAGLPTVEPCVQIVAHHFTGLAGTNVTYLHLKVPPFTSQLLNTLH